MPGEPRYYVNPKSRGARGVLAELVALNHRTTKLIVQGYGDRVDVLADHIGGGRSAAKAGTANPKATKPIASRTALLIEISPIFDRKSRQFMVTVTPPTAADSSTPTLTPCSSRTTPLAFCSATPPPPPATAAPAPIAL